MFWQVTQQLLEGFESTLKLFCITLVAALPLGLIISFGSMSKFRPLKWLCKTLIWIIRGTPLVLQMIIVYYGPGLVGNWAQNLENSNAFVTWLAGWTVFDRFVAVSVAFIINYACYFSEIFRGGIEAIPKGQYEAGQVLGMTRNQIFRKVVFMQVVKRIIPPMSNEIITLVKDTSLARVISVYEIIWAGEKFMKLDGLLWPLFYTGVFYLIFCGILTVLFNRQIMKYLDSDALAVYATVINISTFVQCCTYSVGQAAQPILSTNYGANNAARIRQTLHLALGTSMVFAAFWTGLSELFPQLYIHIFMRPSAEILAIAPAIIRRYSVSFVLLPVNIFSTYYFQSILRPKDSFIVSIARGLLVSGLLIFALPALFAPEAIWWAMPLTELVTSVYAAYAMRKSLTGLCTN